MKNLKVLFITGLLAMAACKQDYPISPLPPDSTTPSLIVPFVSTASTNTFVPFGDTLPGGGTNAAYLVYLNDTNASVSASTAGYVKTITQNPAGDYLISIEPKRNSVYTLLYNHVTHLALMAGDSLTASTILGKVGVGGAISLQINKTENNSTFALCPDSLASSSFRNAFNAAINQHNFYHSTDSVFSPCSVSTLAQ